MKPRTSILCAICLSISAALMGHGALTPAMLKKLIPEAENFVTRQKALSPQAIAKVEQAAEAKLGPEDKNLTVYVGVAKDSQTGKTRSVGAVIMLDTRGANGLIDLAVSYGLDGVVRKVMITKNGDDKALDSAEFLKQLEGKKPTDNWDAKNFKAGANPMSTRALIQAVRRGSHLVLAFST